MISLSSSCAQDAGAKGPKAKKAHILVVPILGSIQNPLGQFRLSH